MNKSRKTFELQDALANHYDVIVIGSGMGGLTAAALLATAGKSVLVVERHDRPGGYAHGFKRKRYHFDAGVHMTSGCGPEGYQGGQVIYKTLLAVGVIDAVDFISVNPFCHAHFPGLKIDLPQTIEPFISTMAGQFPDAEPALRRLIMLSLRISEQAASAGAIMESADNTLIHEKLALLFRYRKATLAEVLDEFIDNPALQAVLAASWPYLGLPPSQLSFVYWSTMFTGYLVDGAYYCRGGFQRLADALVKGLIDKGGNILYKLAVARINVDAGRVTGITLDSGHAIRTQTVISNADMLSTVYQLVGKQHFPATFVNKLQKMQQSLSIFAVYIATDLALNNGDFVHETFSYDNFDHDYNFLRTKQGDISWISITIPTLTDPGLAPPGEHLVMLTTLLPFDLCSDWTGAKNRYQRRMLELADKIIPGLSEHLLYVESGSPATMQRYTLNHQGSAYGWDVTPEQVGPKRIGNCSPLQGLYFAGHWTAPGGGVYGVCVSGMMAAQQIVPYAGMDKFFTFFRDNVK